MSLRARVALAFALVGAVVAALVGLLSYHAASEQTFAEVDRSLAAATASVTAGQTGVLTADPDPVPTGPGGPGGRGPGRDGGRGTGPRPDDGPALTAVLLAPDGTTTAIGGRAVALPLTDPARGLAAAAVAGRVDTADADVGPDRYRVRTTSLGDARGAVVVAADVDRTRTLLTGMAAEIAWVSAAVLVAAALAGWLLARRITRRLVRLAAIAEDVSAHGRLDREVPAQGHDEVGRLAASFTTMLGRLAAAREAQDRLVQDAAHELRTPLTSLRTNASVLRRYGELSPAARDRLVDDVVGETRELSDLVDELVALALSGRDDGADEDEPVDLAALARRAAARAERRTGRAVHVDTDASLVRGRPAMLERAIGNLLENAAKFDAGGTGPVELQVRAGRTTVTDHGPGIDPGDAARVFDRFFRADTARALPGSGLGLAIVRDVAEAHGGTAFVGAPEPGGGARVGFDVAGDRLLPGSDPEHVEPSPGPTTVGDA